MKRTSHWRWLWLVMAPVAVSLVTPSLWGHAAVVEWLEHPDRMMPGSSAASFLSAPATTISGAELLIYCWPLAALLLLALPWIGSRLTTAPAVERPCSLSPIRYREVWALLALMLLGLALRMRYLGDSLWYDEIAAYLGFSIHGPGVIAGNYFQQSNHPLYSLMAWASSTLLGVNEITLRIPAVTCGTLFIPACWLLARELGSARPGRIAASAAAALMPIAILESADARGYSAMALFSTASIALLLRSIRTSSGISWAAACLALTLAVLSQFVSACVGVGIVISGVLAWTSSRSGSGAVAGILRAQRFALPSTLMALCAGLLSLLLLSPMLPDIMATRSEFLALDGNEPRLLSEEGWHALIGLSGSWVTWSALPALLALLWCAIVWWRSVAARPHAPWKPAIVFALLFGGGVVAVLGTQLAGSWLYARFLCFMLGSTAVVFGLGADELWPRHRRLVLLASLIVSCSWLVGLFSMGPRQQLREAIDWIASAPTTRSVVVGLGSDVHLWYSTQAGIVMEGSGPLGEHLTATLERVNPTHVMLMYPRVTPPRVGAELSAHGYETDMTFPGWMDWGGGEIVVFRRKPG